MFHKRYSYYGNLNHKLLGAPLAVFMIEHHINQIIEKNHVDLECKQKELIRYFKKEALSDLKILKKQLNELDFAVRELKKHIKVENLSKCKDKKKLKVLELVDA